MTTKQASFGAGCFWGVEASFRKEFSSRGAKINVGYQGGHTTSPSYKDVCGGETGHAEVVHIEFNDEQLPYADIVSFFWKNHAVDGSKKGQYRSSVFFYDDSQKSTALESKEKLIKEGKLSPNVSTSLEPAGEFYPAEEYHQDYESKNAGYDTP
eukprot:TRINITY_DN2142_c0_g1_i1.p2 TRINITY_DN2142_c0_g1~~TRINITY_DN2142_c0_g1_i1.p2  ORF type:complete len:154 (-),score=51.43 TRINITY_DN2142_c0_g1_i1:645-1106(-)